MKKFLSYVLTFLVMFFISAATTVSLTVLNSSNVSLNTNTMAGDEGGYGNIFSGILASFDTNKQFNINGDIDLDINGKSMSISVYANADIENLEDLRFEGYVGVKSESGTDYIEFSYLNSTIFLTTKNTAVKVETSTLGDLVKIIKGVLPTAEVGSAEGEEGESLLDSLMPKLLEGLGNMTQTELENGDKQIVLKIDGFAEGEITLNQDGEPKKVVLSTDDFEGITLDANIEFGFDSSIVITSPETLESSKHYLDAKRLVDIINQTVALNNIEAWADIVVDGNSTTLNALANISDGNYSLGLNNGLGLITYLNKDLYVAYDDINFMLTENLLKSAKEGVGGLLEQRLATSDLSATNLFDKIVKQIKAINTVELINTLKTFSLQNGGLSLDLDGELLGTEGKISLFVNFDQQYIDNLTIRGKLDGHSIDAALRLNKTTNVVSVDEDRYLNVENIININKDYYTAGGLSAIVSLGLSGKTNLDLSTSLKFDQIGYLDAQGLITLNNQGYNFGLVYDGDRAYLDLNDISLTGTISTIKDLIKKINPEFSLPNLEELNIKDLLSRLDTKKLDIKQLISSIKRFDVQSSSLLINLDGGIFGLGDVLVEALFDGDRLCHLTLDLKDIDGQNVKLEIELLSNTFERREIAEESYLDVESVINLNRQFFTSGELDANIDLSLSGENELGLLSSVKYADKYLELAGNLTLGQTFDYNLVVLDKMAYLKLNNIAIMGDIDEITSLLEEYGIKLDKNKLDVEKLKTDIKDKFNLDTIKIEDVLTSVKTLSVNAEHISMTYDGEIFGLGQISVDITLSQDRIQAVDLVINNLDGNNIVLNLVVNSNQVNQAAPCQNDYLDVLTFAENVYSLKDLSAGQLEAAIEGTIYGKSVEASVRLGGDRANQEYMLALVLSGDYDINLDVKYLNGQIYLRVDGSYVKIGYEKLLSLISGVQFDKGQLKPTIDFEQLKEKLAGLDFMRLAKETQISADGITLVVPGELLSQSGDVTIRTTIINSQISELEIASLDIRGVGQISLRARLTPDKFVMDPIYESDYLDIESLGDMVINLFDSKSLSAAINLNVKNADGTNYLTAQADLQKLMAESLLGKADILATMNGESISLQTTMQDGTLYASYNGLNVMVANARINEIYNRLMSLFGQDADKYSDYIYRLTLLLSGAGVQQLTTGLDLNLGEKVKDFKPSFDLTFDNIYSILKRVQINSNRIWTNLDGGLFGLDGRISVDLRIKNGLPVSINLRDLAVNDKSVDLDLSIDYNKPEIERLTPAQIRNYIDLYELTKAAESTIHTLMDGSISGNILFEFMYKGEKNPLNLTYGLRLVRRTESPKSIKDYKLEGYLSGEFEGTTINIKYTDRVFYLDIMGLNIYAEFDSINDIIKFINTEFGTNINFDATAIDRLLDNLDTSDQKEKKSFEEIFHTLATLDLDLIDHVEFGENSLDAQFKNDMNLFVIYNEKISQVIFNYKDYRVELNCTSYENFDLKDLNKQNYEPYTILTDAYYAARNTLDALQFNVKATATTKENGAVSESAVVNFAMDMFLRTENDIQKRIVNKFRGDVTINQKSGNTHLINFGYMDSDQHLYFDYDSLKLSMDQNAFRELLAVVLNLLNFDPSTIAFLQEASKDLDLNKDNLQGLAPNVDFGNPLVLIGLLKSLSYEDGTFKLVVAASKINEKFKEDITVSLTTDKTNIQSLGLENVYLGKATKSIDLLLQFTGLGLRNNHSANGVEEYEQNKVVGDIKEIADIENRDTYIDITDSPNLVKAIVNTTSFKDFHIKGDVQLGFIGFDAVTVHTDIRVKLDEDGNPTLAIEITNYPLLGGATAENTNGGGFIGSLARNRSMYIYYRDGYIYLRTYDEKWGAYGAYDRRTKISLSTFLDNLEGKEGYVHWLLGFSDSLQNQIDKAIEDSRNSTAKTDISKVLEAYSYDGTFHNIQINLGEIIHNPDIGSLSVGLSTYKTKLGDDTEDHDYLYSMNVNLELVNVLDLKTSSGNPLHLDGSGQPVDLDTSFMDEYAWPTDGEYSSTGGRDFIQTNEDYVTITLDNNGGQGETSITGKVGAKLELPTPVKEVREGNDFVKYKFLGWYTQDGNKYAGDGFPRQPLTLYAHWEKESSRHYYNVTIHYNDGRPDYTFEMLEGEMLTLEPLTREADDHIYDKYCTFYTFEGYYLNGEQLLDGPMPANDIEVDVLWDSYNTPYYDVEYDTERGETPASQRALEGTTIKNIVLENEVVMDGDLMITYSFDGWYDEEGNLVQDFTLTRDIKLTARWQKIVPEKYDFIIKDGDKVIYQRTGENGVYEGTRITIDENTLDLNSNLLIRSDTILYLDKEFNSIYQDSLVSENGVYKLGVMPKDDFTIYVRNKYTITYEDEYGFGYSQDYYQGETIVPLTLTKDVDDDGNYRTTYTHTGYTGLPSGNIMPNNNVVVKSVWEHTSLRYTKITFHLGTNGNLGFYSSIKLYCKGQLVHEGSETYTLPNKILQGETIDLTEYEEIWKYSTGNWIKLNWVCQFHGFSDSRGGDAKSSLIVSPNSSGEMDIYALVDTPKQDK